VANVPGAQNVIGGWQVDMPDAAAAAIAGPAPAAMPMLAPAVPIQGLQPVAVLPASPAPAVQPVPAPWFPTAIAPATGQLIDRVGDKLTESRHKLSSVTEELIGVGSDVDQTEKALLGRIVDAETARSLMVQHQEMEAANKRAHADMQNLREQAASLTKLLAQAHQEYIMQGEAQRMEEKALETKLATSAHATALVERKLPPLRFLAKKLTVKHTKLAKEAETSKMTGVTVHNELQQLFADIRAEAADEATLRRSLVEVHNYSVACHARANALQADVAVAAKHMPKTSAAGAAAEKQSEATQRASSQRLQAEGVLLRAQIQQTETSGAHALENLKADRLAMSQLEGRIIEDVQIIGAKMNETKKRTAKVQEAVQENINKRSEDAGRKASLDLELRKLHERVSPVIYAALDAENMALKAEISEVTGLLAKAKRSEVGSYVQLVQNEAEMKGQQMASAAAQAAVRQAEEDGRVMIGKALQEASKNKAKAEILLQKSNAKIAERCNPEWDKRDEETDEEVKKCRSIQEELLIVNAQKDTLLQTLKAQQTAAATDDEGADAAAS